MVERRRTVRVNAGHTLLNTRQKFPECRVVGKVRPQDVGINQEPDQRLYLGPVTIGNRNPYEDVVLAGVAMEQCIQHGGEDSERAGTLLPA